MKVSELTRNQTEQVIERILETANNLNGRMNKDYYVTEVLRQSIKLFKVKPDEKYARAIVKVMTDYSCLLAEGEDQRIYTCIPFPKIHEN